MLLFITRPIHMKAYISTDAWDPIKPHVLNEAVEDFNGQRPVRIGLRPVVIDPVAIPSGDAELALKEDPSAAEDGRRGGRREPLHLRSQTVAGKQRKDRGGAEDWRALPGRP